MRKDVVRRSTGREDGLTLGRHLTFFLAHYSVNRIIIVVMVN